MDCRNCSTPILGDQRPAIVKVGRNRLAYHAECLAAMKEHRAAERVKLANSINSADPRHEGI